MKPYTPNTRKGRTVARDDIHHGSADVPKESRKPAAKAMRHAARQEGRKGAERESQERDQS
jgi:hypothetical protein